MKANAPQPERATTSFTVSWGLLTISVSAHTGLEPVRVVRKEFTKTGDPVGRVSTNKTTGAVIDRSEVVRMAESTSGVYVELLDEEMEQATQPKGLATIEEFIRITHANQHLTEGLMQIRPKRVKGKCDPAGEKAFALLMEVLKIKKVVALVKVALRGPARYALLDQDGYMRYVVTADAIRKPIAMPAPTHSPQELELGLALVDTVGIGNPTLVDDTAQAIQAFVDNKAAGITPMTPTAPSPTAHLLEALQASIKKEIAS